MDPQPKAELDPQSIFGVAVLGYMGAYISNTGSDGWLHQQCQGCGMMEVLI